MHSVLAWRGLDYRLPNPFFDSSQIFPWKLIASGVWGRSSKTSCLWAALTNGSSAACLDADDGHRSAMGHPGGVIVPAATSISESVNASGRQFIEAVIVGYEIGLRVGIFLNRDQKNIYFGSGTWAAMGATAACARLMHLDPQQILSALSIAEVNTPLALIMNWINLRQVPDVKEGMGWSALTGVSSALLAQQGVRGIFSLTEHPDGGLITRGLGSDFEILRIYYKLHSSCRWTHAAIDGILQIADEHQIDAAAVKRITVQTHRKAARLDNDRPSQAEAAQYSIPYTVAAAFLHGCVGPRQMVPEAIRDPQALELAQKIEIRCDEDLDRRFPKASLARVTLETVHGETLTAEPGECTKGDFQDPFEKSELERKFLYYAGSVYPDDQTEKILRSTKVIEDLEHIDMLTRLLRANAR
jgi:2-methylcitrate dehydratase PrpD